MMLRNRIMVYDGEIVGEVSLSPALLQHWSCSDRCPFCVGGKSFHTCVYARAGAELVLCCLGELNWFSGRSATSTGTQKSTKGDKK